MILILLLAIWPFSAKHKPTPAIPTEVESPYHCEQQGGLYFYAEEGSTAIGVSSESCDNAEHNWGVSKSFPVKMSNI